MFYLLGFDIYSDIFLKYEFYIYLYMRRIYDDNNIAKLLSFIVCNYGNCMMEEKRSFAKIKNR